MALVKVELAGEILSSARGLIQRHGLRAFDAIPPVVDSDSCRDGRLGGGRRGSANRPHPTPRSMSKR